MTFLDLTVEVRSILIRHYWQVTPVFLACKTVVSLQLHMRRGKVLGTWAKKEWWEGEKRKINAPTLLTPLDLASYSGSAPYLKVLVSHCYPSYFPLFLLAIHALSSFPSFAESLLSQKKLLIRSVRFPPRNKEFLLILECKTKDRATLQTRINRPHNIVRYFPYCPFPCYYMYSLLNPASPVILKK